MSGCLLPLEGIAMAVGLLDDHLQQIHKPVYSMYPIWQPLDAPSSITTSWYVCPWTFSSLLSLQSRWSCSYAGWHPQTLRPSCKILLFSSSEAHMSQKAKIYCACINHSQRFCGVLSA